MLMSEEGLAVLLTLSLGYKERHNAGNPCIFLKSAEKSPREHMECCHETQTDPRNHWVPCYFIPGGALGVFKDWTRCIKCIRDKDSCSFLCQPQVLSFNSVSKSY